MLGPRLLLTEGRPGADAQGTQPAVRPAAAPATCRGWVALTFDDGPTPSTAELVAALAQLRVPATFFNRGDRSAQSPQLVALQRTLPGAACGNHTWDHPDLALLTPAEVREQVRRPWALPGPRARLFRPPYGSLTPPVLDEVRRAGLVNVLWTVDSKDFAAASTEAVVARSAGMEDGGILLLHDGAPFTVAALPRIVDGYQRRGLCFGQVVASTRAQSPAGSPALLFAARAGPPS